MRKCIVRDLDFNNNTTAPMDCDKAIALAQSGKWGKNWSLEACLENPHGSAPILKVLIQFKDGKYINLMATEDLETKSELFDQTLFKLDDSVFKEFEDLLKSPAKKNITLKKLMESKPAWK